ncbi:rod shape-determining protein MreC [Rubricella aquisinus]|uniref:Cell shape-determining protein MreC n=1 Tax=Rubricella aquisinus TaxID=2028108 RepID=A0A840WNU4_9RHOB|nr:rod shape-determining protein MreC [Rubricella aquisinus]MBB5516729.1 rod shape-determining protein MreC [Rubricella aquisinus]
MTRQVILGLLIILSVALFALWRIDNPRVERLRMAVADAVFPAFDWTSRPAATLTRMAEDFESYVRVYEENQELRREVQDLRGWREAAIQLEQRNARLRALNNVRLSPQMRFVTGEVLTDTGGPFSQSGLVNVGRRNGVQDGAAAMDGLGLVGRVSGVGEETSRIIYLTDINSRVPVVLQRTGQRAVVTGDNTGMPLVQFVEAPERVRPGDRVMTSGDGRVLPPDLLVGVVVRDSENRLRVRPAAEYARLEFVRILNFRPPQSVEGPGGLIGAALPASPTEEGVVNE